jgi:L-seryl-tRNA(Ser) seleniumtransferase
MKTRKSAWSRRRLLQTAGISSILGGAGVTGEAKSSGHKTPTPSIYDELGVRTLINGQGVVTFYSCTLMPPEVHRAMERASEHYVEIVELQRAVGARLAEFAGTQAAMVCSGSAACIAQATAACIAGMDPDKIYRLPDTEGMKNEVIITHRSPWDRGIALCGAKLVVVNSMDELESAFNERTAMMEFAYGDSGSVKLEGAIGACKRRGVPFMLDGAAECPPFERLKMLASFGTDLFCVSGGKGLMGPQCSGILFGRKDLIEAALHNGSPFEGSICRPMKVGKEEIIGVLAAVEWSSKRDYQADCRVWESRLNYIAKTLNAIPGVQAQIYYRKVGNEVPHLAVLWDQKTFGLTKEQCVEALRNGEPHIEVYNGMGRELVKRSDPQPKQEQQQTDAEYVISITSNTLQPGDERLVAQRLKEILKPASFRARGT